MRDLIANRLAKAVAIIEVDCPHLRKAIPLTFVIIQTNITEVDFKVVVSTFPVKIHGA